MDRWKAIRQKDRVRYKLITQLSLCPRPNFIGPNVYTGYVQHTEDVVKKQDSTRHGSLYHQCFNVCVKR